MHVKSFYIETSARFRVSGQMISFFVNIGPWKKCPQDSSFFILTLYYRVYIGTHGSTSNMNDQYHIQWGKSLL